MSIERKQATQAEVTDSMIREASLANGFTIKDGHSDLKPYVYAAARAILAMHPERVHMTEGTARQFVEWMKAQPDDREPTTIDGALAEFEAHHGITAQAKKETK